MQPELFSRLGAREQAKARSKRDPAVSAARSMGVAAVRDMNPDAVSPNMAPDGARGDTTLVLLECPSVEDDAAGLPLQGDVGSEYRSRLKQVTRAQMTVAHICPTLPKGQRRPSDVEVAAFRDQTETLIERLRPRVVVAAGQRVMDWLLPGIGHDDTVHRGRAFPVMVGEHSCWVYAIICPTRAATLFEKGLKSEKLPGDSFRDQTWRDIKDIRQWVEADPPDEARPTRASLIQGASLRPSPDMAALAEFARTAGPRVTLDLQTTHKRPQSPGATVRALAVSDGATTLAIELGSSPPREWPGLLRELVTDRVIVSRDLSVDYEWLATIAGTDCALLPKSWECVQMAAYCVSARDGQLVDHDCERRDDKLLAYLCRVYLGSCLEDLLPDDTGPTGRCRYGSAMVAIVGLLSWHLRRRLRNRCGLGNYRMRMQRIPALVGAQIRGVPVDQDVVRTLSTKYRRVVEDTTAKALATDAARKFAATYRRPFDPANLKDSIAMLGGVLRNPLVKTSADKSVFQALVKQGGDVAAISEMCLRSRDYAQRLATYLDKLCPDHPQTYIWPDGRIHPTFLSTWTGTTRSSSRSPNSQNNPKRDPSKREVRSAYGLPEGWGFLASDLGQIEARGLAMTARDPTFVDALWTGLDIHRQWTERILEHDPGLMERRSCDSVKALRGFIKGEFVFAQFYGAGVGTVADRVQISRELVRLLKPQFWAMFPQIKVWQKQVAAFYKAHGFVESLLGSRRYGPLSYNMIINTPIQSLGSDICMIALVRMLRLAIELKAPWLQPTGIIHDDLTFETPESERDAAVPLIARAMVHHPELDFVNVPLTTEFEWGRDLAHMETLREFTSTEFAA